MVATVYRPADRLWDSGSYPYGTFASHVDAFGPMVYRGSTEPGLAAGQALDRSWALRPVHVIGQRNDMGTEGGRSGTPGAAKAVRFPDVAAPGGAVGASFWDWLEMADDQWDAVPVLPWATGPEGAR